MALFCCIVVYHSIELSEYVIQQDEEGEALLATICSLKRQLAMAKEEQSKVDKAERTTTATTTSTSTNSTAASTNSTAAVVSNGLVSTTNSLEDNSKIIGTIQRSQE